MQTFPCKQCGKIFKRSPAQVIRGSVHTCSRACRAVFFSGKNSPWWNRQHSEESKKLISESRKGKCIGNHNATGYKHTQEAIKRISEASKKLWKEHRNKMIASLPRGESHFYHKLPQERRYRVQFTPLQRREWKGTKCAFCGTTEHLELDHIIPIFDGGKNERSNCQTLCRGCNLFKTHFVDVPRYFAHLGRQRD